MKPVCANCSIECTFVKMVAVTLGEDAHVGELWECNSCHIRLITNYAPNALVKEDVIDQMMVYDVRNFDC